MIPDSLNIRKALEMEIPISDIFRIDISSKGNQMVMRAHEDGMDVFMSKNSDVFSIENVGDGLMYSTTKTAHKVGENLDAYIYDSYLIYPNEDKLWKLCTDKTTEIEFLNTQILTLDEFCRNVMDAQAFSGLHEKNIFRYSFIGAGSFAMGDYVDMHRLASQSRVHFIDFFVFHKKVFSSISFFLSGLYENDINSQKEYLTKKELKLRLDEAKKQKKFMSEISGN